LLEENTFVRGVLVKEDQAAIRFQHDIKPANNTQETQRDAEKGYRG
jgi:hypothetical protein